MRQEALHTRAAYHNPKSSNPPPSTSIILSFTSPSRYLRNPSFHHPCRSHSPSITKPRHNQYSGDRQTAAMPGLTSAAGLIGLLDEPDQQLRCFALQQLDNHVHQFWAEIADEVSKMCVTCLLPSPTYPSMLPRYGSPPSLASLPPRSMAGSFPDPRAL